jgi:MFS family permease
VGERNGGTVTAPGTVVPGVRTLGTFRRTFSSLSTRNYRIYFGAQLVSMTGTWMQGVGQAWLVLQLTGSGTALGLVTALQFLPVLLLGPVGGLIADRFPKRRIIYITQTIAGLQALILGLLVASGEVQLWMVYVLALGLGFVNLVDNPTRQVFVVEMVGEDQLTNAVTLNSVMVNVARAIGPALAGAFIATIGLAQCFFFNAGSYVAVIIGLSLMRASELHPSIPQPRAKGQVRDGLRYVRRTPELLVPLLLMAVVGTLAYEFQVILPLMAKYTFDGGPGAYGAMSSAMGIGAVIGGLITASMTRRSPVALSRTAVAFGILILICALAPTMAFELVALCVMGAVSITFLALGNTTLQLASDPAMRGRVMALWAVAFLGSTPIGGPIIGWIGQNIGPRWGLAVGGVATLIAGALAYKSLAALGRKAGEVQVDHPSVEEDTVVEALA